MTQHRSSPSDMRRGMPTFIERTSHGTFETTPYNKLFEGRIIFVGTPIDDAAAHDVITQLLCLEADAPDRPISIYINSPGGSLTAMTAIYDTMQYIRPEIETLCLGQAASVAALLLAAGRRGKRAAVPHARVSISQPRSEVVHGQTSDLSIQAKEIDRLRRLFESALASATARTAEDIRRDIERETILTAEAAREYGLIDAVLSPRKASPLRS